MTLRCIIFRYLVVAAVLIASEIADAQPSPAIADEPTAISVAAQPGPGDESGRIDADPGDSKIRKVVRGALFVPRVAVAVAFAPIEGGAWATERYQLIDRADRLFYNDAGTIGLVPTLSLESGFGVNAGARFTMRDAFGQREHFTLRASTGGRFHEKVATRFRTGDRLGMRNQLAFGAELERRPKDSFYGVGNLAADGKATYRHRLARVTTDFDSRVLGSLHVRAAAALADHTFGPGESGRTIDDVYQMDELVGVGGVRNLYGELELRWDSRTRASVWDVISLPSAGSVVAAFAGRVTALDDGEDFWRYGIDLQHFISLGDGPRVLSFRSHGEAVTRDADQVPFIELTRLGGDSLRGYAVDRFRDRVAVVGSAEYRWDLAKYLSASLFVDAGKVSPTVRDLDLHDLRVGYGAALDLHSTRTYIARATLASSIDGGAFLTFALDPVSKLEARTDRR